MHLSVVFIVMLSDVILSVIMLNVVMLSVVAPFLIMENNVCSYKMV
jgi:hypothetical protein